MTVGIQSMYPVPLKENGLVESYKENAFDYAVPKKTIYGEAANIVKLLESKPGFNPNIKFDPSKHLKFSEESYKTTKKFTLQDLNINKTHVKPMNDFGAVFPFELLTQEAIDVILWEALQPDVLENDARLPNLATNATRLDFHVGCHLDKSPFTKDISYSKELSDIVSNFVGVKLSPVYDCDLIQINCSLATNDPIEQLTLFPQTQEAIDAELARQDLSDGQDIPSTVGVHYDSISVPLVIMLDLPSEAQGGQTTIITGDNKSTRVPDPTPGCATLIQGRVLRHLASKPVTNHNRISMVLSYGSKEPELLDNLVTTSTKPSVLPKNKYAKFYSEWTEYKLQNLENHMKWIRENIVQQYEKGEGFNQEKFVEQCSTMEKYLRGIWEEMECVDNPPYPPPSFKTPYADI
ncbi:hypothetical protein DAMA08_032420 [Martiniozyma asiatica (nom. inval.)]|nr:hypothetical protein DAMA08_032420 [Martiniozyma asiatica]